MPFSSNGNGNGNGGGGGGGKVEGEGVFVGGVGGGGGVGGRSLAHSYRHWERVLLSLRRWHGRTSLNQAYTGPHHQHLSPPSLIVDVTLESRSTLSLFLAPHLIDIVPPDDSSSSSLSSSSSSSFSSSSWTLMLGRALDESPTPFPKWIASSILLRHGAERVLIRSRKSARGGDSASLSIPWLDADDDDDDDDNDDEKDDKSLDAHLHDGSGSCRQGDNDNGGGAATCPLAMQPPSLTSGPAGTSAYVRFAPLSHSFSSSTARRGRGGGGGHEHERKHEHEHELPDDNGRWRQQQQRRRFRSILRSISGARLSCSPFDSAAGPRDTHGWYRVTTTTDAAATPRHGRGRAALGREFEASLGPRHGGSFCLEALRALQDLGGAACGNGKGGGGRRRNGGVFAGADATLALSDALLGRDARSVGGNRAGTWVDVTASRDCFSAQEHGQRRQRQGPRVHADNATTTTTKRECVLGVSIGATYSVRVDALPTAVNRRAGSGEGVGVGVGVGSLGWNATFSLGDVLLRRGRGDVDGGSGQLKPCPLADTSVVQTILPHGRRGDAGPSDADDGDADAGRDGVLFGFPPSETTGEMDKDRMDKSRTVVTHNLRDLATYGPEGEGIDLARPWLSILLDDPSSSSSSSSSTLSKTATTRPTEPRWSVERTVSRPRGVANSGTIHTSYRFDKVENDSDSETDTEAAAVNSTAQSKNKKTATRCDVIKVRTMDVFPDAVRPILHTMRVGLYWGGGAGGQDFVPSEGPYGSLEHSSSFFFIDKCKGDDVGVGDGKGGIDTENGKEIVRAKEMSFVDLQSHGIVPSLSYDKYDGSLKVSLEFELHPDSSLWLNVDYDPSFWPFEHFPSDPNRGVDLPPSVGSFVCASTIASSLDPSQCWHGERVYSDSIVLMPPIPDMSMPFNVISLTCTLYAFVLGTMVNFLVRKSSQSVSDALKNTKDNRSKLEKIKEKIRTKLESLKIKLKRARMATNDEGKEEDEDEDEDEKKKKNEEENADTDESAEKEQEDTTERDIER